MGRNTSLVVGMGALFVIVRMVILLYMRPIFSYSLCQVMFVIFG